MHESKFILEPGEAALVELTDVLSSELVIPVFQRPYDWRTKQVDDLIDDLAKSADTALFLGLIVLHKEESGAYTVIDGQQRITSLLLLLGAKGIAPKRLPRIRDDDSNFFRRLIREEGFSKSAIPETLSQRLLQDSFNKFLSTRESAKTSPERATCIAYVAPRLAGATSLFERINMRGRDVSQLDLVKNRLIGWLTRLDEKQSKETLLAITKGYDKIYRTLNPLASSDTAQTVEYDADRLLRVHWILFTTSSFSSSDRVIDAIEQEHSDLQPPELKSYIEKYVDTLHDVAQFWIAIQNPKALPTNAHPTICSALNEFHRLNRFAEFEPLVVAVMHQFGLVRGTANFIRLCTILSFRDALAKRRSNRGRSPKWTMARAVYQQKIVDATGTRIASTEGLAHHLFWKTGTWWSNDECGELDSSVTPEPTECANTFLNSGSFYKDFKHLLHYFFWEYGFVLGYGKKGSIHGWKPAQANHFDNDPFWHEFRMDWDIEHVFPQNPDKDDSRDKRVLKELRKVTEEMKQWVNHLGNLTVVPKGENRGLLSNKDFITKRDKMLNRKEVRFNELFAESKYIGNLIASPFWGPNNCKVRFRHLSTFADERWGTPALKVLGVGGYDKRVDFENESDEEGDDSIE